MRPKLSMYPVSDMMNVHFKFLGEVKTAKWTMMFPLMARAYIEQFIENFHTITVACVFNTARIFSYCILAKS